MNGLAIQDEFAKIPDRKARRYFRLKKAGLCVRCAKRKAKKPHIYCTACRVYKKQHFRRSYKPKLQPYKHTPRPSKYL